ncbi:MAG: AAA family ATPase [Actinobacteria bacterium]|jgi:predicted kinase|nr:AAA family ATPase [Actinomycetota bacterium]
MLIVISGLPATGKTTLAAALARRVRAVHLSVDTVEDALLRSGLEPGWTTGVAAYEAVSAAAQQNLVLGLRVVVDAVNDSEAARQVWRDAAKRAGDVVRFVLLLPPNVAEHQRRLRTRERGLEQVPEPSWSEVEHRTQVYEAWPDEPLVLAADEPIEHLVKRLDHELSHDRAEHTP